MKYGLVTVIGSINYDIMFNQDRVPHVGETLTSDGVHVSGGGKGANQAIQLAKLNVQTNFIGALGNDIFGDYLLENLKKYEINIDHIKRVPTNSGIGVVHVFRDGTVAATISKGANYRLGKEDIEANKALIEKSEVIVLQLEIPDDVVEYAVTIAHQNSCFIVLNAAPARPLSNEMLAKVDCFIVNETEASFYSGKEIYSYETVLQYYSTLLEKIKTLVIVTLGEKGSVLCTKKGIQYIPSVQVTSIDSTGAGDSYVAAFVAGILRGKDYTTASVIASHISALTVTGYGAQDSMPSFRQVQHLYD